MSRRTLRSLLRPPRRSAATAGWSGGRTVVVGGDATVAEALRGAGLDLTASAGGPVDLAVVLDPAARPLDLPRTPLRIGLVAAGEAQRWTADHLALEDVDAVVAATAADAATLATHAVRRPAVGGADAVPEVFDTLRTAPRAHLVTGVSNLRQRHRWGDHHFAVATARALSRAGWVARSWCQAELPDVDHDPADLGVLLAGKVELAPLGATPTVAWVISHPDRLDRADGAGLAGLTHLHVASPTVAADLAAAGLPATHLPQATDPDRFRPTPGGTTHELLFVANSRNVRRRVLDDLLPTDHDLAVYGSGWTPELVDPRHVVADHLPNAELPAAYTAAAIVLNDHWDAMRERGLLSNRLFDAAACGACVVSDDAVGLHDVFGDTVTTYATRDDLRRTVDALLADPGRRRDLGDRARAMVVDHHTFDDRVRSLLGSVPAVAP